MAEVNDNSSIQLFEDQKIRTAWDAEKEEWYFSIVDVVAVLTEQKDSRSAAKYWSVLKVRLKNEGSELHFCLNLARHTLPLTRHQVARKRALRHL